MKGIRERIMVQIVIYSEKETRLFPHIKDWSINDGWFTMIDIDNGVWKVRLSIINMYYIKREEI